MKHVETIAAMLLLALLPARAETVLVPAVADTTLIEEPQGGLANGAGPTFFVGRTNQTTGSIRRGLVRFDLAAAVPHHANLESATLHLTALPGNPGIFSVRLYRILADWGEGASFGEGGRGAPSEPGDATWIHTFYDTEFWEYAGGQFLGRASAAFEVSGPGSYAIEATPQLLADLRLWVAAPGRNFGWILIGDETNPQTAQSFATREAALAEEVPTLEITFTPSRN